MAEVINTNVFDANKKFVDFAGLDYFWEKAKAYVDGVDSTLSGRIDDVVGDVADLAAIVGELTGTGSEGTSIADRIDAAISALDLPNTYEAKGVAADAVAEHAADAVAHVTADERAVWNAAKTAIDTFLKDADMTEKAVDTLAELQTYMTEDGAAAAELIERIADLEAIDHEAYIAADSALETSLKGYVDGKVDGKFDAAGTAEAAITALNLPNTYDAKGAAATAKSEAIAKAAEDAAAMLASYYTSAQVDGLLSSADTVAQGYATAAQGAAEAYAKTYTDALFTSFQFASIGDIDGLFATQPEA